jgi:uncharacterized DUF497 family protein
MLKSGVAGYNFGESRAMEFEWDEDKRRSNLEKHEVDFRFADALFNGLPTLNIERSRHDEVRFVTTCEHLGRFYTVVWTQRDYIARIISMRRSNDSEKRKYRAVHG